MDLVGQPDEDLEVVGERAGAALDGVGVAHGKVARADVLDELRDDDAAEFLDAALAVEDLAEENLLAAWHQEVERYLAVARVRPAHKLFVGNKDAQHLAVIALD